MQEALGSIPVPNILGVMVHPCKPQIWDVKCEEQKFKVVGCSHDLAVKSSYGSCSAREFTPRSHVITACNSSSKRSETLASQNNCPHRHIPTHTHTNMQLKIK